MSGFKINDYEFDIQDLIQNHDLKNGQASGQDFKKIYSQVGGGNPKNGAAPWVKESGSETIRHLEPDELVDLNRVEQVGFTTPFNTAGAMEPVTAKTPAQAISLTIQEQDWIDLRMHLFQDDQMERQAFLELGMMKVGSRKELYLHRFLIVPDEECAIQSRTQVMASGRITVDAYNSYAKSGVAVHGHVHSHPFTRHAVFSGVDRECQRQMMVGLKPVAKALQIEQPLHCLLMVMGAGSFDFYAELVGPDNEILGQVQKLTLIGRSGMKSIVKHLTPEKKATLMDSMKKRISKGLISNETIMESSMRDDLLNRNIKLLGQDQQQLIAERHIALCGAGGVGAMLVANLRGMGFKEFTLIDPDRLELSNLNRFPGAVTEDVGSFKVDVLKRELQGILPDTVIRALACGVEDIDAGSALRNADILIAGVDGMAPRAELQILAARLLKPFFDVGTGIRLDKVGHVIRMGGQIIAYLPGGPCLECQGMDIFRPETGIAGRMRRATGYVEDHDFTPTSVAFINSMAAGLAADLVISYLTGLRPIPAYLEFDQWNWQIKTYAFAKRPHCQICGANGIEGKGLSTQDLLEGKSAGFSELYFNKEVGRG